MCVVRKEHPDRIPLAHRLQSDNTNRYFVRIEAHFDSMHEGGIVEFLPTSDLGPAAWLALDDRTYVSDCRR